MHNYHIKLYWKGLKGDEGYIGEFLVSEKILDKLQERYPSELSIDCWAETEHASHSINEIENAMKNTEYGKIAFKRKESVIFSPDPFYQKHILASLKEATGVEWNVLNHRYISKPRFIENEATYEWWEFQHLADFSDHGDIRINGMTCNGRFISSGMWNMYISTSVTMPDYNGNSDFEALAKTFNEKFQSE